MKRLVTSIISASLSLILMLGGAAHQFAFYVMLVMNILAWLAFMVGSFTPELKHQIRSGAWINSPLSALSLFPLITTDHPVLAASSFILTALILVRVYQRDSEAAV